MEHHSRLLQGVAVDAPFLWLDLSLSPQGGGVLVSSAAPMERTHFQRQVSLLRGYLALAAARRKGAGPIQASDLPRQVGPEGVLAVWYARSRQAETTRDRLMASYNAFGALPGAFPAVRRNLERWLGPSLGEKLMAYIEAVRQEEDDLGGHNPTDRIPPVWTQAELDAVDQALLAAARGGFSD